MLSAQQRMEAGGASWKETVIGVRDAYLAMGLSASDAERDVKAIWDSSREGPNASAAAIAKVNDVMEAAKKKAAELGTAQVDAQKAIQDASDARMKVLTGQLQELQSKRDSLAQAIAAEAPEEVMGVIETGMRAQLGVLDDQIKEQNRKIQEESDAAAKAMQEAIDGVQFAEKEVIIRGRFIPPSGISGYGGSNETPEPTNTAHTGGFVTLSGISRFHRGTSNVLGFPTNGLRAGEVPAILQTHEAVLNRTATRNLGPETIRALNAGAVVDGASGPQAQISALEEEQAAIRRQLERMNIYLTQQLARDMADSNYELWQRVGR
jgi:hypothetical protein